MRHQGPRSKFSNGGWGAKEECVKEIYLGGWGGGHACGFLLNGTLNGTKIRLSGGKKQKLIGSDRIRRSLDESTLWRHIGIVNIIRQQLKDIEQQRWLSEVNNDTRKDANQGNKMRTYRLFKTIDNYKCEDYLHQVTNT